MQKELWIKKKGKNRCKRWLSNGNRATIFSGNLIHHPPALPKDTVIGKEFFGADQERTTPPKKFSPIIAAKQKYY